MNKNITRLSFLVFAFLSNMTLIFSQKTLNVNGEAIAQKYEVLDTLFSDYQIYKVNSKEIVDFLLQNESKGEVNLTLSDKLSWTLFLEPANMMGGKLTTTIWDGEKTVPFTRAFDPTFKGISNQGAALRFTIDENYFSGSIRSKKQEYILQPLRDFVPTANPSEIVVFEVEKVKKNQLGNCGVEEIHQKSSNLRKQMLQETAGKTPLACYQVDIAACTDFSFYQKYSSNVTTAQNRCLTILNLVEGDYATAFTHNLKMVVVRWFNSTSSVEPWSNSTDSSVLIAEFKNWGNANLTGAPAFDIGQLWTNRTFNSSVIGIAYVGAVCSTFKYQCLQDFTTGTNLMRVMVSHETGHSFNCSHDASGTSFIMAPSVSNVTAWSPASVTSVNAYLPSVIGSTCLGACATGVLAPLADFSINPNPACSGATVSFTNSSTNSPTSYSWTFQNGTPSTSTAANPTVTFSGSGTYTITLTASNAGGSNTTTRTITINPLPVANFTSVVNASQVNFTNTSTSATTYSWAFQSGTPATSTATNPVVNYASVGTYNVTLTATNACGSVSTVKTVTILQVLSANFSAANTSGCTPFTTTLTNTSVGATSYNWQLPGSTTLTSTATNPSVTYNSAGKYSITLTANNGANSVSSIKTDYITVNTTPIAGFTYVITGNNVTFTNTSTGATSYNWAFGNGSSSSVTSPSTTYATTGNYSVTLTAISPCGQNTSVQNVSISVSPTANFTIVIPSTGCAPFPVQFNNLSLNATSYEWTFPGGNPSSSILQNPNVTYNSAGTFTATLKAINSGGSSTFTSTTNVIVGIAPTVGFSSSVAGKTATFTSTSTNVTDYLWKFGDNTPNSTESNPVHTYANDGTYSVTLTVTNDCGTNTSVQNVLVTSAPKAAFSLASATGCAPFSPVFNNTSSSNSATYVWTMPGATPSSSTAKIPNVTYNSAGTYSITLVVTNTAGKDTFKLNNALTIGASPQTSFTSLVDKTKVTFTNTSTNAVSYLWNFGDGTPTSTLQNPIHTYLSDGNYTVSLTATNNCNSVTYTKDVLIVTPPKASFGVVNPSGCAPFSVTYSNTSSANASTYQWTFTGGNPSSSTLKNPIVTYDNAGNFGATLVVSNAAGKDTFSILNVISVNAKPQTIFTTLVDKAKVTLTNTSINAISYAWKFGDGDTSSVKNPIHNYTSDGDYTITLTATNACGSTIYTKSVSIVTPPKAAFSLAQSSACLPFAANFNNTSSNNSLTYNWTFVGGTPATSTEKNPTVTYNSVGSFEVTLIVSNSLYQDTLKKKNAIVTVAKPSAAFSQTVNGGNVSFINNSIGGNNFTWIFGDGTNISTVQNPTHTYNDGVYTVKLIVTSSCGSDTSAKILTIVTLPKANFTAVTKGACAPLTVDFNNNSSANASTFNWDFVGAMPASSTDKNPTVVYKKAGEYDVRLISTNSAGSDTIILKKYINVNDVPTVGFSKKISGANVQLKNATINANSYKWDFGDNTTSTDKDPSHTYTKSGKYIITLFATNACGTISISDTIFLEFTKTSNTLINNVLHIYPNPNQGYFNLVAKGNPSEKVNVAIQNTLGQMMYQQDFDYLQGEIQTIIEAEQLPKGSYILIFSQEHKRQYLKFSKL
jgi:PKD repeat protein